jgi:hypothetical protein
MNPIGANAKASAVGLVRQSGVVSYFIGNDPKNWRSGVPTYGKVNLCPDLPPWVWSFTVISASSSTTL